MAKKHRVHFGIAPVDPPVIGYPARFAIHEGDSYIKYGHTVFSGSTQRGDSHWTAEIITQTWYQAETGQIPISGAGYGGKFSGEGFDGIWLDMSEIVRPTRDGIHGREYISTSVNLGGRFTELNIDALNNPKTISSRYVELPIPLLFNPMEISSPGRGSIQAIADAAAQLGALAIITPEEFGEDIESNQAALAARVSAASLPHIPDTWQPRYIEIESTSQDIAKLIELIRSRFSDAIIGARLALSPEAGTTATEWAQMGIEVIHLYANEVGRDTSDRPLPDALREIHLALIENALRDRVTLIASGGIAAAEHVAKAIACGADIVAIDLIIAVALGCSLWADKDRCPVEDAEIEREWGAQRLVNLMAAWRNQLLEALGAMGIREIRRLRGEIGRTIWHRDEEKQFRATLGGTAKLSNYPRLPAPEGAEGDYRWPLNLLLSSQEQSRSGKAPSGAVEYRIGESDGGFDRIAFAFEMEHNPQDVPSADPMNFDLSIPLNRRDDGRPDLILPLPWYGAGMSYGSVGVPVMASRARAAQALGIFTSTGEGGYPDELSPYADHIITQVATGLFGVSEKTLQRTHIIEIKYAQGAKPGLGGHLLGSKNTESVSQIRETTQGTSLFSPFPFHSVYSVEDHKKHVDWLKQVNARALISVKVSTPGDVDMVAVGSYYAGAHIVHLDGAYGGTGAAPEIAKKNIAMPIEYAIPRVHQFLVKEGIRDTVTLMASGGIRTAFDVAKAIALGADGVIIGTAELVAIGCIRIAQCEKGLGCPFGITTTDPEHAKKIDADVGWQKIVNLYTGWQWQIAGLLDQFGMKSIRELRGRKDLLLYLED